MQNSDISYLLEIQKLENKIGEYVKSIDSHSSRTKTLEKQISSKKNSLQEMEQKTKLQKNSLTEKVSKISYYGVLQSIIFHAMQGAVMAGLLDEADDITDKMQHDKNWRMVNSILDSNLRGIGAPGAIISAAKNGILQFHNQEKKGWRADHARTVFELAGVSPTISGKLKQLYGAFQTYKYNRDVIPEMGKFDLENPIYNIVGNVTEATVNLPLGRLFRKI